MKTNKIALFALSVVGFVATPTMTEAQQTSSTSELGVKSSPIVGAKKLNATTVEIILQNQQKILLDFYGNNIFRYFLDPSGNSFRKPQAKPEAEILIPNARKKVQNLSLNESGSNITIDTDVIAVVFDKKSGLFSIKNKKNNQWVVKEASPVEFQKNRVVITLKERPNEYFYGGGVQNGRFSHKGRAINIVNENSWTDGGVASPKPFYWSTEGYGFMWYTFKKGKYDFGTRNSGVVKLQHDTNYADVFFMVSETPVGLLNDYYQLTGNPVLLPKFGFYQGHLNAYNRDYWKEDPKGILFEDGKKYKESQKDNGGIKESLNGEKNNYQFSARAVVDRYSRYDMPLGWILPNDGYGAGYGQTNTLEGNIQNLKQFTEYANKHGVEVGLWTQSDLHPKKGIEALLQRDIIKEVKDAGVRVLKTDVAWVGAGYSFGLNGVQDVAEIMPKYGNDARPFIISLDGWAGTQHYAGIWSGDQTGGNWEYIRFHIPTYLGSGLSGQPNISSDMDGIFGGKNPIVNIRDFQWKTFTPMQLNMDGWGANPKYPHILGEPTTSINRNYLKLKSELMPYIYSVANEAVDGDPIVRAMLLAEPNPYTLGKATEYQFLCGENFLVAPIYQATQSDDKGNDVRNNIYLPQGLWIDYFSGDVYQGGQVINNFDAPIWKLPVFVKAGAIIPMANPNNNVSEIDKALRIYDIYPHGKSSFTAYDDDGLTQAYLKGKSTKTIINSDQDRDKVKVVVEPTSGDFKGFVKEKITEFRINVSEKPKRLKARIGRKRIKLKEVHSLKDFMEQTNVYFYNEKPNFNQFATKGSEFEKVEIIKNPQILVRLEKTDVAQNRVELEVKGFKFNTENPLLKKTGALQAPQNFAVTDENIKPYSLRPTWTAEPNADFYEIMLGDVKFSTIKNNELLIENLTAETPYELKLRAVNKSGASDWETLAVTTKANPLQFAIEGIQGEISVPMQEGFELSNLFDRNEGSTMHTKYRAQAVPFDIVIDLKSYNELDKFSYLPRVDGGNGIFLKGKVYTSEDKKNWTESGTFSWDRSDTPKVFNFEKHPTARFVKIAVTEAVGNYGSGREIYVFKVPGTESYIPGDINNDGKIDQNDFTSYINYTGLKQGDSDFEGYVSRGDVNKNGWIDAYDISNVATQLEDGVNPNTSDKVEGNLNLSTDKKSYQAGEDVIVTIKGKGLKSVNALSLAIPYNSESYEFVSIKPLNLQSMENLTNDRLHSSGEKVLYPTFVNVGEKPVLDGDLDLCQIIFKAKKAGKPNFKAEKIILVDKNLNTQE
ncbi:TIM-barrel domain-containing protein [Ornithobacterium rhinotracheale]|uniref:TIM-barrel domain-containing protein n=1 Tax=Ornithobacterium rhinotracheale TaxID=28251 RepID=UPI00403A08A2